MAGAAISVRSASTQPEEWTLLELQGSLVTQHATLRNVDLGDLTFLPNDKVRLQIGKQVLEGSMLQLKKPQAVLSKRREEPQTHYEVVGVIRRKVSFTARPTPLIERLNVTEAENAASKRARTVDAC